MFAPRFRTSRDSNEIIGSQLHLLLFTLASFERAPELVDDAESLEEFVEVDLTVVVEVKVASHASHVC